MPFTRIMIAVDSSEYSMLAAKEGLQLAHQLNAKAALLFVIDRTKETGNIDAGITSQDAELILKKEAEQTLDQLSTMYNGNDLAKFMPEGRPTEDILKTAEVWQADLIVMGTYGRVGLMSFLFSSVAEYVIKHSNVPVMVVPSK